MKINIASVLKNDGAAMNFSGEMPLGKFVFMGSNLSFDNPLRINGTISNIGGTIEISAEINAEYTTQCSRCNETVSENLNATLFESVKNDFSDADDECLSICGTVLDISGSVMACIFNEIPLKFLCSDECKGLCPVCGINLNKGECNCDTTVYDPRFAIFRNIQQRGVKNGSSEEKNF